MLKCFLITLIFTNKLSKETMSSSPYCVYHKSVYTSFYILENYYLPSSKMKVYIASKNEHLNVNRVIHRKRLL